MKLGTILRLLLAMLGILYSARAVADPTASLEAPASATAGSKVAVKWTGPAGMLDRIAALPAGSPDTTAPKGLPCYPAGSKDAQLRPAYVKLPEEPGEYELRYFMGGKVLARRKISVRAATATIQAPATAVAGSRISVAWRGPNNEFDKLGIVKAGAPERTAAAGTPNFTGRSSPMGVNVPEQPGEYEIRYLTGAGATLARANLTVTAASASISVAPSVVAGNRFPVTWTGPAGEYDAIVIAKKGSPDRTSVAGDFTMKGSPLGLGAPVETGEYELRYKTGATGTVLARATLRVIPGQSEPGFVKVTLSAKAAGPDSAFAPGAVEVVLDASGSMLQRIGSERRIDIAKHTLGELTGELIPPGTPFALRVLGRGADTCQSELDIPFAPLDRGAAGSKIAALQAKGNARTPISAALERVSADLAAAKGERVVILVSDGEETCGGNPARTIQKLVQSGLQVRVNIVGFAVDDDKLAAKFETWSHAAGGSYFDARDAKALSRAFSEAVRPTFELIDAQKNVIAKGIVGGDPVRVLPGTYSLALKGRKEPPRSVTVRSRETSAVTY
ncbi:MAG TPA: VWA domain-containing protein [Polyangiaceae bacterium]|nr:VWA domain-containing protein [Polyangiaceae bacterium]